MKRYSTRERVAAALLIPVFAPVTGWSIYALIMDASLRSAAMFVGALGGMGATAIAVKIAITGRATPFLEQSVGRAFGGLPPNDKGTA